MISDDRKEVLKSIANLDLVAGSILFRDGDVLHLEWEEASQEDVSCMCGDPECTCDSDSSECTCDDSCDCLKEDKDSKRLNNSDELMEPPARFYVVAGGHEYWCTDVKINALGIGMDVIWVQKIGDKDVTVMGTLYDTNISVFDYQTNMTVDAFASIKRQQFDFVMAKAKDAKDAADAKDGATPPKSENVSESCPENRASVETVMKSYN